MNVMHHTRNSNTTPTENLKFQKMYLNNLIGYEVLKNPFLKKKKKKFPIHFLQLLFHNSQIEDSNL